MPSRTSGSQNILIYDPSQVTKRYKKLKSAQRQKLPKGHGYHFRLEFDQINSRDIILKNLLCRYVLLTRNIKNKCITNYIIYISFYNFVKLFVFIIMVTNLNAH